MPAAVGFQCGIQFLRYGSQLQKLPDALQSMVASETNDRHQVNFTASMMSPSADDNRSLQIHRSFYALSARLWKHELQASTTCRPLSKINVCNRFTKCCETRTWIEQFCACKISYNLVLP